MSIESILSRYPGDATSLVMVLQDVQSELGYLPAEALDRVSQGLRVPRSRVWAVAEFYHALSLEPRGEHLVRVCMGTACHVRGAPLILDAVERELEVAEGGTTADRRFTVQSVGCVGACAIGPVVEIDDLHHGHMTVGRISRVLKRVGDDDEE
jgi:NADH-quinone oxidoreductase subunit E